MPRGKVKKKLEPILGALSAQIFPPCSSTRPLQMLSPKPKPVL